MATHHVTTPWIPRKFFIVRHTTKNTLVVTQGSPFYWTKRSASMAINRLLKKSTAAELRRDEFLIYEMPFDLAALLNTPPV